MLSSLLRFELKYHFRQISFKVAAILFVGLGILATQGNFGGHEVHKNAPYVISYITSFLSLFSIFVSTLFCANVVLRDTTYEMDAIIFTTSLQRLPYFLVRLLGLLAAVFSILSLAVLGICLGTFFMASHDQLGTFHASYFLQPLFVFGLPNVLFCCSVIFSMALLTRSMRAVYVAGVLLFILYFLGSILGDSPIMASSLKTNEPSLLPYLMDPFGLAALFGETRSWPVAQRNSQLFPVAGVFLANRLLWLGIAFVLLILSYRYFKFRLPAAAKTRKKQPPKGALKAISYKTVVVQPRGFAYNWSTFTAQLKLEVTSVFKHIPFLVMLALWIFMYAVDLKEEVLHGPYGIRFYAATGFIVEQLRSVRPALLLLIFYAAELISRERAVNMQGLIFSTPVPNVILWGAKCTTLAVLVAVLITANISTGIGMQLFTGYAHIEPIAYLSLFYYSGLPLFLFAILIVFIQTIVPNKYLGMLVSIVVVGIFVFGRTLGIKHYLLRYATLPDLQYAGMNGFGHYTNAVNGYMLYWTSFAVVLSLLGAALWQGSTHTSLWQRVRSMGRQWGRVGKLLLVVCLLTWIATGVYINGKTPRVSTARSSKTPSDWLAAYEKKYKPQARLPQPHIIAIKTSVDLYPGTGSYTVQGNYRLRNESGEPISTLWLGVDPEVTAIRFSVPGATLETADPSFKQYWYALRAPLLPGGEMSLAFSMEVVRSGFMLFNSEHSVVSNGSYIELEKYVPFLGYNDRYEVDDPFIRSKQGLPPLTVTASTDSNYHLIDLETTVSTSADQQVVTVGTLQKEWLANNRHYFHYKTEQPIAFMFALSSARYAVQKETWQNIECSIYYQPGENDNVPVMMEAMKDAVAYGDAHFSPYPFKQLILAAIPHYPGAATAYPGVLFSAEKINFMSDYRDSTKFNNTYAITAHEVGHQWWANKLAPLPAPGRAFLTESLAKYTEFMAVEKRFGKMYLRNLLQTDNQLYFSMRNMGEQELPLSQTDQPFVYYQKGGLALYAIKEELGEGPFREALQRLVDKHAFPRLKATPANLLNELYQEATPVQVKHIDDYVKKVIVYDTRLQLISCKPLSNGQFSLTLQVNITKIDQTGAQPQILIPDDSISIAVFDQSMDLWDRHTQPVYLQQQSFSKAVSVITITVNKKPAVVAIDPWGYLLDENQQDNVQEVK
jgi:hypothetical protein